MAFRRKDVERLLASTGRRCCICKNLHNVQVHHILPKDDGGSDSIDNGIPLCPSCHDRVHVKPSVGRTTRDYSPAELRLHRDQAIIGNADFRKRSTFAGNVKTNVEVRKPALRGNKSRNAVTSAISVNLSSMSKTDCEKLGIPPNEIVTFVKNESKRHPLMFSEPFVSLPLIFGDNVLILAWDGLCSHIERILTRSDAYPVVDAWSLCLGSYRSASLLSYRSEKRKKLVTQVELKRILATYRKLVLKTTNFVQSVSNASGSSLPNIPDLRALLTEAEFAFLNGRQGVGLARLEGLLSNVHKLLLRHAPQGVGARAEPALPQRQTIDKMASLDSPSILLVDDMKLMLNLMHDYLQERGYRCTSATSVAEALSLLVEQDFDLIITDLLMPGGDGREIALAARNSGSRAKIFVVTGYERMAVRSNLGSKKFPCDKWISKPFKIEDLMVLVNSALRSPKKKRKL